jgi:hypothetical protein
LLKKEMLFKQKSQTYKPQIDTETKSRIKMKAEKPETTTIKEVNDLQNPI